MLPGLLAGLVNGLLVAGLMIGLLLAAWNLPVYLRLQWALWCFRQGCCRRHLAAIESELKTATDDQLRALLLLNRATSLTWMGAWPQALAAFDAVPGEWLGDLHQLLWHNDRFFCLTLQRRLNDALEYADLLSQALQRRELPGEVRGHLYRTLATFEFYRGNHEQASVLLRAVRRHPGCRLYRTWDRWLEAVLTCPETLAKVIRAAPHDCFVAPLGGVYPGERVTHAVAPWNHPRNRSRG